MTARKWQPPHPAKHVQKTACPDGPRFTTQVSAHNALPFLDLWRRPMQCRRGCGGWHLYDTEKKGEK